MPKEKIYNIPNALTLLRLLLIAPVILLIYYGRTNAAIIVYGILIMTDFADGHIARWLRQTTDFGEYFDFAVDFLYYYAFIIYFIAVGEVHTVNIILIAAATVALVWIAVTLSRKAGYLYMPHWTSAKVMAVLFVVSIGLFILDFRYANEVFFFALLVTFLYTVPDYIRYTISYKGKRKSKAKTKAKKKK
jgi:phosphatidylglycerophosphate synthase